MKVNSTTSNQSAEVSGARAKGADKAQARKAHGEHKSAAGAVSSDAVKTEISSRARELSNAKNVANAAPETREEKIAELKRRIAEGKYHVDAKQVADKMVDEHLHMSGIGG